MLVRSLALTSLLLVAAIFGFFYAYTVSAMWGLDASPPSVAIEAMQGINNTVRNVAFFPAFFLTPVLLGLTAFAAHRDGANVSKMAFGAAALIYLLGGIVLTASVNIPMNNALGLIDVPQDPTAAAEIWSNYSPKWQVWNLTRTVFSGIAVVFTGIGLLALPATRTA
ncbi:anthrone oxygenase family protein [Octadecabacter ascidiaceicola]|uniref:DUF1772 domain-containing protein n=1 Tax=Octadecabacter ascidiaceicola TaxID=1655543 RepID=A0A238K3Z1_9RHOB|nr:anthrone oxygenase family protein [Octadecabacter ascidiaceicola]SMX37620.1 hypothetical protein OCA8868_01509 [Octadecabacter ascidiaceicola]